VNKIPVAAVYAAMLMGAPAGAQQTPAATGTATSNPLDAGPSMESSARAAVFLSSRVAAWSAQWAAPAERDRRTR